MLQGPVPTIPSMNAHSVTGLRRLLPWHRGVSRGQAVVEFAIVLPVLAMLLVMSIDLGRVYFGWVGLQNAARIGANYAALHSDAWSLPDNPLKQQARAQYAQQIAQDSSALNCTPRPSVLNVPAPVFINVLGSSNAKEMGDHVSVTLNCTFELITPLANSFFSGGVPISANAVFTNRAGTVSGIPTPAGTPTPSPTPSASPTPVVTPAPCQAPIANFVAVPTSGKKPLTVRFTDTSIPQGCPVLTWDWDFGDGTANSSVQNPSHVYTKQGTYAVKLIVTSAAGSDSLRQNGYVKVSN
jgi:hypothetical protein